MNKFLGNLTLTCLLKVETGSGRSLTAYATVRIHVIDSNDHIPRVSVNTLRSPPDVALLPVNADIDAFVAYVSVADPDTGSSGRVTCSLHEEQAPPTHFRLQRLSPTQFQIVTSSPVDRGTYVNHFRYVTFCYRAMLCIARTMLLQNVCLFVCLYVCHSHAGIPSKRLKHIINLFTILVFRHQAVLQYPDGGTRQTGALNAGV